MALLLGDYVYRTKEIAELQSRLPDKQYASRKIGLFYRKRTRHKHAMRAMLKDLFERMKQMGITKVAVGDLSGIRKGNSLGTHTNQKLHNFWSHRQTVEWIQHLCEECNMQFVQVPEDGTSISSTSYPYSSCFSYTNCLSLSAIFPSGTFRLYFGQKMTWYWQLNTR